MQRTILLLLCLLSGLNVFSQDQCDSILFDKGVSYLQADKLDKAIAVFDTVISKCPGFTAAFLNRGICYYYSKNYIKAKNDFDKTLEIAKAKYKIAMLISNTLFDFEKYEDAYTYFKKASDLKPAEAEPYFKMGRCLWLGHIPIVLEKYKGDYMLDPEYKSHLKKDILHLFDKATSLDSTSDYQYFYYKGIFYSNFKEYKPALLNMEKSIAIHPVIIAYQYSAVFARELKQNNKACNYITQWASMINPAEEIDVFQKKEIAQKFCKELGVKQK